jgi:hypothetical protein
MSFAVVLAFGASAMAHHSLTGTYDFSKRLSLNGTIAKVSWQNPHSAFTIDVKTADGATVQWIFTTVSSSCMERNGIGKESFAVGSTVTVRNAPVAKDGSRLAYVEPVEMELPAVVAPRPAAQPKPSPAPVGTIPGNLVATFPPNLDPEELGHCVLFVKGAPK